MTKKYPFFRDGDEQAQAVIGEDAIAADLNGTYQKPYAVLTQKRLYCKNERGNFIVGTDKLSGVGIFKGKFTPKLLLWAAFGIAIIAIFVNTGNALRTIRNYSVYFFPNFMDISFIDMVTSPAFELMKTEFRDVSTSLYMLIVQLVAVVIMVIAFPVLQIKLPKINSIFLCAYSMFSIILLVWGLTEIPSLIEFGILLLDAVILVLAVIFYCMKGSGSEKWFEIRHSTGTFTFSPKLYPAGELKNFEKQVKALQAGGINGQ